MKINEINHWDIIVSKIPRMAKAEPIKAMNGIFKPIIIQPNATIKNKYIKI